MVENQRQVPLNIINTSQNQDTGNTYRSALGADKHTELLSLPSSECLVDELQLFQLLADIVDCLVHACDEAFHYIVPLALERLGLVPGGLKASLDLRQCTLPLLAMVPMAEGTGDPHKAVEYRHGISDLHRYGGAGGRRRGRGSGVLADDNLKLFRPVYIGDVEEPADVFLGEAAVDAISLVMLCLVMLCLVMLCLANLGGVDGRDGARSGPGRR